MKTCGWIAACLSMSFSLATAADWPQWRGPTRNGQAPGTDWPEKLSAESLETVWHKPLDKSYSGPLIVGGRVITTETRRQETEAVVAFDLQTGKQLWQTSWKGAVTVPFFAASNGSWIRATPAADATTVYVAGMRDVLVALDLNSGEERWRVDFVERCKTPLPAFGFVSSPLLDGDALYVQAGAATMRLDKKTGAEVWRSLADGGGMWGSAFSSPVLHELNGVKQLLVQARERIAGLDPETGAVLWEQKVPAFRGMNILTPVAVDNRLFTSSYGGKSLLWTVRREGDKWEAEEAWNQKSQGYMSTPILHDGRLYLHLRNQRLTCLDWQTGKETWTTTPFGKYQSLVARGDKALALDERGELLLFRLNPTAFESLGTFKLPSDDSWAHLAVSDDWIVVRELEALGVYRWKR